MIAACMYMCIIPFTFIGTTMSDNVITKNKKNFVRSLFN